MISQLNQRERIFVIVGGFALVLAFLYFAILTPYRSALNRFDQQIAARSVQLEEIKELRASYLGLKQQMTQVERLLDNRKDFSALTFVENLVEQTTGRDNLLSMRPQSPEQRNEFTLDSVEIKLEKLTLEQVLELLAGIDAADIPMQVKNLYLKQQIGRAHV